MAANEMKSLKEKYKEANEKLKTYENARLSCSCGAIVNAEKVKPSRIVSIFCGKTFIISFKKF